MTLEWLKRKLKETKIEPTSDALTATPNYWKDRDGLKPRIPLQDRAQTLKLVDSTTGKIDPNNITIACFECRKPLWAVEIQGRYGTRTAAKKTPYPGVGEYRTYWSKTNECLNELCPHCHKPYFQVLIGPNNTYFPKVYSPELDGV